MLYNINNLFNVQNSGSGISILTGFSSSYFLNINENLNANKINYYSFSGQTGNLNFISGTQNLFFQKSIADSNILNISGFNKNNLPPKSGFVKNVSGYKISGQYFSGQTFTGNNFICNIIDSSNKFYINNVLESDTIIFQKEIELNNNLYINNPSGKIEINKNIETNNNIISNAHNNVGGISISGYTESFSFQGSQDGHLETYIYGNDSAGTIFLKTVGSEGTQSKITGSLMCKIFFTGNYSYEYPPSVVLNVIDKQDIFNNFWTTNVTNSSFDIATILDLNFRNPWEIKFNYLVIS